jgi:hypothetical protein
MDATEFRGMVPQLIEAISSVQAEEASTVTLQPFTVADNPALVEGVVFLKPEATDLRGEVAVQLILELLADQFESYDVQVDAVAVLGSAYLKEHRIIDRHYGAINRVSTLGTAALSDDAQLKLRELFGADIDAGAAVLGGHQVLELYPEMSPKALDDLVSAAGGKKLAPGTYCAKVTLNNKPALVVNGFHPQQLAHFTASNRSIAVMTVRSTGDWKTLRDKMLGATNPANAQPGSLRRIVLDQKAALGLAAVDQGNNAAHFSAGPLEGMIEVIRYFSTTARPLLPVDTCFGRLLEQAGITDAQVEQLMTNPPLTIGDRRAPAFDLLEEINPDEAIERVKLALGA